MLSKEQSCWHFFW